MICIKKEKHSDQEKSNIEYLSNSIFYLLGNLYFDHNKRKKEIK